ncbi:MAG: hypothetical protein Q8M76_11450 [Spirochaetaceae bacterium]|nr:hypothetical protein [Spirochaetaceae bacterium]
MSVERLTYGEPFFEIDQVVAEPSYAVRAKSIVLNLAEAPIKVGRGGLGHLRSAAVTGIEIRGIDRCLVIKDFEKYQGDLEGLFSRIKGAWKLAFDATGQERHKGVLLWRSPKHQIGGAEVNFCFAEGIPLNVGLHREHWGGQAFKEVHTQVIGYGKMQQCREKDPATLYREDLMSPGCTHEPMYDEACDYPWHQYETVTKGIFQALEMRTTGD